MQNGRIEPLLALPVHREAQPSLQWAKSHCFLSLMGSTSHNDAPTFSASFQGGPGAGWGPPGNPPKFKARTLKLFGASGGPLRPFEALKFGPVCGLRGPSKTPSTKRPLESCCWKLVEVGIEGAAVNPNRK